MTTTQTTADQAIREARRLRRRARWADFVGGLAAVVLISDLTWATTMVVQATTGALNGLWQVSVGLTGAAAGVTAIVAWRALRTRAGLASWAAGLAEIDTAEIVQTGLELAGQSGGSSALRSRAIARAEPGIAQVKRRVSDRWRRCAALAIAAAAMVTVTGSIATAQASLWGAMVQEPAADRSTERAVGTLVVDLQLQVTPPRYAADAARGGVYESDAVEALVGSDLLLKATPMAGVSELKLVLRDADETTTALALTPNATDGLVQWPHRLERSLSYRFVGRSRNGVALVEKTWRRVDVRLDQPPTVQLQQPDRPVEVRVDDEVLLVGKATDDIGLNRLEVVLSLPTGQTERRPAALTAGEREAEVRQVLSVADLKLRPGEVATVWLECADLRGDQRPGKLSRSRRIELRLFSIERAHTRLLGALAEVAMQWTLRLAARLEAPVYQAKEVPAARGRRDTLKGAEETALKALDELITAFEDDPLADSKSIAELSAVARELRNALEREAAQLRKIRPEMSAMAFRLLGSRLKREDERCVDKIERGLEKMVQLLQFEHGARMRRMANKLSRLEDRLEEVLKRLQDSPEDEDLLAEAQRLTEAIDRAMKAMLASAMARMPLAPAEAANAGASAQRDQLSKLKEHADHLQEIKDALRRGDVKAAQRALKANRERMRATLGGLNKGLSKEQVERDAQTGRWVQRLRTSIDQLESAQGGVRELAAPLADAQRRNEDREIKNRFDAKQQELQSLLSDARDQLRSKRLRTMSARNAMGVARARAALAEVAKSLDERRLDRALRGVTEASQSLRQTQDELWRDSDEPTRQRLGDGRRLQTAHDRLMRLAAKMRQLQPDPRATLPPQGQATSRRLAQQQSRIQRQLQRTQRRMHQGRGRHPGIERRVGARLEHAEAVMRRASEAFRRSDARRGESLMGEAQQALQQAQELLRQPESGRSKAPHQSKSAGGSGAQRSGRREAGGRDDRSGGGDDGISRGGRSGMELRSGNSNDDGGDFRRDVMRAMKRSAPAGYGKRVRQYLRALTEDRRK